MPTSFPSTRTAWCCGRAAGRATGQESREAYLCGLRHAAGQEGQRGLPLWAPSHRQAGGAERPTTLPKRKRALLLHCLGAEGQRIFYTLTDGGTSYESAVTALCAHFKPPINVVVERHKFRQRVQRPPETVAEYVGALRELAVTCEFAGNSDEMIRDQLIEHASCPWVSCSCKQTEISHWT